MEWLKHLTIYNNGEHIRVNGWKQGISYFISFDDNLLAYETHYVDNEYHGTKSFWYKSGHLCYKENYIHGKQHGIQLAWYDGGKLLYEENYINGVRQPNTNIIKYKNY